MPGSRQNPPTNRRSVWLWMRESAKIRWTINCQHLPAHFRSPSQILPPFTNCFFERLDAGQQLGYVESAFHAAHEKARHEGRHCTGRLSSGIQLFFPFENDVYPFALLATSFELFKYWLIRRSMQRDLHRSD